MTTNPRPTIHARLALTIALLVTGVLAGAFFYGWAIEAPTFADVPLNVHLTYRVTLMDRNGAYMPLLGIVSVIALIWTAIVHRSTARWCAAGAAGLAAISLLTTRFGNVPINGEIRRWAAGSPPADYLDRLNTWDVFHDIRVAAALAAFLLAIVAVNRAGSIIGPRRTG